MRRLRRRAQKKRDTRADVPFPCFYLWCWQRLKVFHDVAPDVSLSPEYPIQQCSEPRFLKVLDPTVKRYVVRGTDVVEVILQSRVRSVAAADKTFVSPWVRFIELAVLTDDQIAILLLRWHVQEKAIGAVAIG